MILIFFLSAHPLISFDSLSFRSHHLELPDVKNGHAKR
jgi:hypothetical protein